MLRHGSYANGDIIDCLDLHTCGRLDLDVSTLASCFSSAEIIKKETSVSTRPTNQGNDLMKLLLVPDYEQIQRRARCRGAGMDLRDHWHARQPVWQPRQRFRTIEGRSSSVQVSDFDDAMKLAHYIVFVDRLANALQPNRELFQTVDLWEKQNLNAVVICLQALGRKVRHDSQKCGLHPTTHSSRVHP